MEFIKKQFSATKVSRTYFIILLIVLCTIVIMYLRVWSAVGESPSLHSAVGESPSLHSAAGEPDYSFGIDGYVVTQVSTGRDVANSVAVQSDGKVVAVGFSNEGSDIYKFVVARYNLDGSLDNSWGETGIVNTQIGSLSSQAFSVVIQQDGKIVVVGTTNTEETGKNIALVRYNWDGVLDASFGLGGIVTTSINQTTSFANSAALQLDGKIIVAGHFFNGTDNDIAVLRYNQDGSLDKYFGTNGIAKNSIGFGDDEAKGVVVQVDGKIIVAGSSRNTENYFDIAAVRYDKDGTLDTDFGINGSVTTAVTQRVGEMVDRDDHAAGIALQFDEKIIIVGYSYKDFVAVRYLPTGKLDETFHGDGIATTSVSPAKDEARDVVIQPDGKIVVVGKTLGSLGPDGTLGSSSMDVAVVRFNDDGIVDSTFGIDGHVTTPVSLTYDVAHSAAILPDGKLIVAGYSKSSNYNFLVLKYDLGI